MNHFMPSTLPLTSFVGKPRVRVSAQQCSRKVADDKPKQEEQPKKKKLASSEL
ncbi:hypothetical protein [Vibrio sp. SCSIO 43136]|uniref:hypothetical protein n=1 Tax=Vibrio sp. SCSIO 43136 TaxID=2819101 RepID=UPI002075834F|nr:hypothetical protein [Vibrio sp. SCSIO 43136]USD67875.1 hypothetical protein J4N39_16965 [Vibrio sp. SCSIO 43136]